jgi:hypothetical protein
MAEGYGITLDMRELDAFVKKFGEQAVPIVERETTAAMDESLEYIVGLVADNAPVNYGTLRGSIYSEIEKTSTRGELTGIVSASDYEPKVWAMERGRAKGKMPPIEAIMLWLKRKGISGTYSIKSKRRMGSKAKQEKEDTSLAWAIAIKISKGTSRHQLKGGDRMFEQALEKGQQFVTDRFDDALDNVLKAYSQL